MSTPGPATQTIRPAAGSSAGRARMPGSPWLRYRDTGLYVLPSKHNCLAFATIPLMEGLESFDKVCLELPSSLSVEALVGAVGRVSPDVGVILLPRRDPVLMRVPEHVGDDRPGPRHVTFSSLIPVTPDSMMSVLRIASAYPSRCPEIELIDMAPGMQGHGVERRALCFPDIDPEEVFERGVDGWYARIEPLLRSVGPTAEDAAREYAMAARLKRSVLDTGCRALFVCGALHWPRIRDLLDSGCDLTPPTPEREATALGACRIDASIMHSWHLMDIPFVAARFEQAMAEADARFDRAAAVDELIGEAYMRGERSLGLRRAITMRRSLDRLLHREARWSCDLDAHLLPVARAVGGATFAYALEQEAMEYSVAEGATAPRARVVPLQTAGSYLLFFDGEVHLVRFPSHAGGSLSARAFRMKCSTTLTQKELEQVRRNGSGCMKASGEEGFHKFMCDRARDKAHRLIPSGRHYDVRPFTGSMRAGMAYRATVMARARGSRDLFVRRRVREERRRADCDICPIVWIFGGQRTVVYKVGDYFPDTLRERQVFTSFFWFCERIHAQSIRRSRIAWFVRLYRNVTPSWNESLVEGQLLGQLPERGCCDGSPWFDPDLRFAGDGPDLAVACAVKWAVTDHVVVVRVDPSYRVGHAVTSYAQEHGVQLLQPHVDDFDPIYLRRYEWDHEVPTRGAWHAPDAISERLVEPIPTFTTEQPGRAP